MKLVAPDNCQNSGVFIWTLTNDSNQCVLSHCFQPIMYAKCFNLLFVDSQGLTSYSSKDVFQTGIKIF